MHPEQSYLVSTEIYQGPLDLLLQLIERSELDITKLALAQVTNSYLQYVRSFENMRAEEISNFLAVAARLMQIKSEALLPRPPIREPGELDPGEELVQQLVLYKRYKEISQILLDRSSKRFQTFLRNAEPQKINVALDLSGLSDVDLYNAAAKVYDSLALERANQPTTLRAPTVTIREKISLISIEIRKLGKATFQKLVGKKASRTDIVVTFLAMLELVKQFQIKAHQENLFGEIEIERSENFDEHSEFELEFSE